MLQSMGPQRVGHDIASEQQQQTGFPGGPVVETLSMQRERVPSLGETSPLNAEGEGSIPGGDFISQCRGRGFHP